MNNLTSTGKAVPEVKPLLTYFGEVLSKGRPFGDSSYITDQMQSGLLHRLEKIGETLASARELLDAMRQSDSNSRFHTLGDPVVRAVIQQALGHLFSDIEVTIPLQQCDEVLSEALHHVKPGMTSGPLAAGVRDVQWLGSPSETAWIWTSERRDDIFSQTFKQLVAAEYGESLCTPTAADILLLQQAAALVSELVPQLSQSAFSHAHLLGVFPGTGKWEKVASSSQFRITGSVFLNQTTLQNPWWIAEHLLHESLHQKLYDFRHGHSLLARDVINDFGMKTEDRTVISLWNTPGLDASNSWDSHRSLAAFHVYVHLALFCRLAEERASELELAYGPLNTVPSMTSSGKAFARARYLGENLRSTCWSDLGLAGQGLVEWLTSILDATDPRPAPTGAQLHLLLDRYLLEAAKIQQKSPSEELTKDLATLAANEAAAASRVLTIAGATAASEQLSTFVKGYLPIENQTAFPDLRREIADKLLSAAPDGYSLPCSDETTTETPDQMVRNMVEQSSHALAEMGAIG